MTCAEKIKAYRTASGLTQGELNKCAGLAPGSVQEYEAGACSPLIRNLIRIKLALEQKSTKLCTFDLFGDSERASSLPAERSGEDKC